MTPIFFPYTYLSSSDFHRMTQLFDSITVYQPFHRLIPKDLLEQRDGGKTEIRIPLSENDDALEAVLKEYRSWAEFRYGSSRGYNKIHQRTTATIPDPAISRIRNEVRDRVSGSEGRPLMTSTDSARIFLALAQEHDIHQIDLVNDMDRMEERRQQLLMDIRGEGAGTARPENAWPDRSDPQMFMAEERLSAWSHLLCHDPSPSCVYVTTNRAAFEMVGESADGAHIVSGWDKTPVQIQHGDKQRDRSRAFAEFLDRLVRTNDETLPNHPFGSHTPANTQEDTIAVTVTRIRGRSPARLFETDHLSDKSPVDDRTLCPSTVIVLVESPEDKD